MAPRVWFVTSSSSGLGRALVEYVLRQGDIVVATLRTPSALSVLSERYTSDQLLVLTLDTSVGDEIAAAFAAAQKAFGRIDVVYNNAGYGVLGEVEAVSEDAARKMFDVDFWGAIRVSTEAVRFFREVNPPKVGGRLLQASSIAVPDPLPALGHYTASKWALEGISEAMSKELDPAWNIKIINVEFGYFATSGQGAVVASTPHPAYTDPSLIVTIVRNVFQTMPVEGDPNKAAVALWKLAEMADPPSSVAVGQDALAAVSAKIAKMTEMVEKYRSLSDDLKFSKGSDKLRAST